MRCSLQLAGVVLSVAMSLAPGGRGAAAQALPALPPLRPIGPVVRVSVPTNLRSIAAVRSIPGGNVLVSDSVGRRVVRFDRSLGNPAVVMDSSTTTGGTFGFQVVGLIAYRGDSTLFVDPAALSMLVLDGQGTVARVMAIPRAQDAAFLVGGPFGTPGFDKGGRLVHRGSAAPKTPARPAADAPFSLPEQPDSAPVVRIDLATRVTDTVGLVKSMKSVTRFSRDEKGALSMVLVINPMQTVDDWAMLSDGTIAIVRGRDFRIDWVAPDRSVTSTGKLPFPWQRLAADGRTALLDSARIAMNREMAARRGTVVDRVRLPPGRVLAGFGDDSTVFLAVLDAAGGNARLEAVRLR